MTRFLFTISIAITLFCGRSSFAQDDQFWGPSIVEFLTPIGVPLTKQVPVYSSYGNPITLWFGVSGEGFSTSSPKYFTIYPDSGRRYLEVTFLPTWDRIYDGVLGVTDNSDSFTIVLRGSTGKINTVNDLETTVGAVYPNPANRRVMWDALRPYELWSITDVTGRVVKEGRSETRSIPIDELPKGMYSISAGSRRERFVVHR